MYDNLDICVAIIHIMIFVIIFVGGLLAMILGKVNDTVFYIGLGIDILSAVVFAGLILYEYLKE